ncbi:MAG: MATE family efflux transporter [Fusobacteriaceae bacterium]|nr:MATE family efflux transporter [Fusobacteriaceae bacterium]MBP9596008.1 MATE family efflux transporter [Fusobacteriaceae bacterium]MBU9917107.1 MATE family efflux transporter [Fusobacteriaceae bacterium]
MEKLLKEKEINLFFKYLMPAVTGTLAIGILIFIDTVFIGRGIGAQGLAALNIALPAFTFYCCVGYLLGVGGATVASIDEGRGLNNKKRIFTTCIVIGLIISAIFVIVQNIYLDEIVRILGAKGDIFPLAKSYLRVVVYASGLYLMPHIINPFVRNDNNPNLTMIGMVACGIVNLTLDYIFIFKFGWGMAGAATATGIAQFTYTMILCIHFFKKDRRLGFEKIDMRFEDVKRILTVGMPSFINEISSGLIIFLFNLYLLKLGGELSVAAYSIIININYLVYLIYMGVGQTIQPLVSYNYGSGRKDRVNKFLTLGLIFNISYALIVIIIFLTKSDIIIELFNKDNEKLRLLTSQNILKYFSATIFTGINVVIATYIQAQGQGKASSVIMFFRAFLLMVIGVIVLSKFFGIDGVWYTTLFSEVVTFIGLMIWMKLYKKN